MSERTGDPRADRPNQEVGEIVRLNKIIRALMDRAERSSSGRGTEYSEFQTTIMLEEQVRRRTAELQAALSENERTNRAVRESEAKFRGVVNQSLVGIATLEAGRFSYCNPRFSEIFGYSTDQLQRMGLLDLVLDSDRVVVAERLREQLSGEVDQFDYTFRGRRREGVAIDIESHCSAMDLDGRSLLIAIVMDITERTRAERELRELQNRLEEQATRDALTGLHNRHYLQESLERELIRAERAQHPVSAIMGDIDHFKAINDRYGHLVGDEVLRACGEVIKRHARGSDVACRYGGEEFLLVLPEMAEDAALERAELLRREIAAAHVDGDSGRIAVTCSFGIASYPSDGKTGDRLIAAADDALYASKAAGRNRVTIKSQMSREAQ